ncbi:MAG TPA: hypothetical protein VH518_08135, partial [Tepidisphaeraceae bacterium]
MLFFTTYWSQTRLVLLSLGGLAALALLAALVSRSADRLICRLERWLRQIASQRGRAVALVGAVSLCNSLLITLVAGIPIPRVHDEFSYLLAGDTFAHGRLTNPTPPLWEHFETMHELFVPTYMSKFHPGQGLTLAAGQVLFGAPWMGVILTMAAACAALTWALMPWLPRRWMLLGGLVAAIHPPSVMWSHSYWGGGVVMLGGSLVAGALGRILRDPYGMQLSRNAVILCLGGVILAASRPYEAFVWAVCSALTAVGWFVPTRTAQLPRLVGPAVLILLPAVGMGLYYNWRVTGDPRLVPYTLHTQMYMSVPLLFWQPMPPPKIYGNLQLHRQHAVMEPAYFLHQRSLHGWFTEQVTKAFEFFTWNMARNLAVFAGMLAAPLALAKRGRMLPMAAYGVAFVVAYMTVPWFVLHYTGAAMVILIALAMQGLRWIRVHFGPGRTFVWLALASCIPMLVWVYAHERIENHSNWWWQRRQIAQRLSDRRSGQLVIVRYKADHDSRYEWVFNGADINGEKVIWARALSAE